MATTDELGLVRPNGYLVVFIPPTDRALVFRVKSRANQGCEVMHYGPLPVRAGETLPTYDGGTATVPENGVLPARSYVSDGRTFPLSGAYDESDMFYLPADEGDRLLHAVHTLSPSFLRADVQIPKGTTQGRFQKDRVITGVHTDFGFSRGRLEVVHLPEVHYGFRWGNDTNLDVYTGVTFAYAEYLVEIPRRPETVFDILTGLRPAHWVSLPISTYDKAVQKSLLTAYGFEGFTVYGFDRRDEALAEYERIMGVVRV